MVYRGLLWVGALQVDPGWRGYLPCPLYNMSDKEVELTFKEPVFTIDFVRTTVFNDKSKPYNMKFHPNPPISQFDSHRLRSGPYDALTKVDHVAQEISDLRRHVENFITFMTAALGIVVAAIGVIAAAPKEIAGALSWSRALILGASILAVVVSFAALFHSIRRPKRQTND
jgi:type IV secretory pathway VirB2 component (pilin)